MNCCNVLGRIPSDLSVVHLCAVSGAICRLQSNVARFTEVITGDGTTEEAEQVAHFFSLPFTVPGNYAQIVSVNNIWRVLEPYIAPFNPVWTLGTNNTSIYSVTGSNNSSIHVAEAGVYLLQVHLSLRYSQGNISSSTTFEFAIGDASTGQPVPHPVLPGASAITQDVGMLNLSPPNDAVFWVPFSVSGNVNMVSLQGILAVPAGTELNVVYRMDPDRPILLPGNAAEFIFGSMSWVIKKLE